MRHKKMLIGFGVAIAVVAVLLFGFSSKIYPVATVNDQMISAKALQESYQAGYNYFSKALSPADLSQRSEEEFQQEVRRASLDTLIEVTLVEQELNRLFDPEAVEQEALRRVNNTTTTEKTIEATQKIMDISLADFKQLILIPEARKEILIEEFVKSGEKYDDWAKEARLSAKVTLFLTDLVWEAGGEFCPSVCVEINKQPGILDTLKEILPSSSTLEQLTPTTSTPQN